MDDRYREAKQAMERSVLEGQGHSDPATRRAAFDGQGLPEALQRYVDQVRRHAYKITDEEVAALSAAGHSDDLLFELTVAASLGAAGERLQRALALLDEAETEVARAAR